MSGSLFARRFSPRKVIVPLSMRPGGVDSERRAGVDRIGEPVDGADRAVVGLEADPEVLYFEKRQGSSRFR
jgi:hypothetical protein